MNPIIRLNRTIFVQLDHEYSILRSPNIIRGIIHKSAPPYISNVELQGFCCSFVRTAKYMADSVKAAASAAATPINTPYLFWTRPRISSFIPFVLTRNVPIIPSRTYA
jgi:hypothetical protein